MISYKPSYKVATLLVSILLFCASSIASAQTTCLAYPSNSTPPSGYAASWDVFDPAKALLVKTNCPISGTTVTLTVGKGDDAQYVWSTAYAYRGAWVPLTLSGTQSGGWIAGSGTATLNAPATASSPFYLVGYVCTNRGAQGWKCGCANQSCATSMWQIQGFKGTGGGGGGGGDDDDDDDDDSCPLKDDLFLNPFNKDSAHHRPIGTGAVYAGSGDASTIAIKAHAGRGTINAALPFGAAFRKIQPSDPVKTVTKTGLCGGPGPGIGLPVTIKIPPGWPPGWQSKFRCLDNSTKLYDPETGVTTEFFAFDPSDPGNYRATIARTFDIRGLGHGTALNQRLGTSASGASTLMGALRAEEVLTPGTPMLHAHHVAVPRLPGHNAPLLLGRGIQWPATAGDGSAYQDATHNTGKLAYGALLGIPPESKGGPDLDTLGLSEPGLRLAQSFRDYGVYVVDGGPQVVMRATDSLGSLHATMRDDFRKLWPHLRLITNAVTGATATINASSHSASGSIGTPTWPAGGGSPLAPNCAFDAP